MLIDDDRKIYIQTSAINGFSIYLPNNLPVVKSPILKDVETDFFSYLYLFMKYIDDYQSKKAEMFFDIVKDEQAIYDFAVFLNYFTDCSKLTYEYSTFKINDKEYINFENIEFFMEVITILHHRDKSGKAEYKPANKLAEEMMKEFERRKKAIQDKISKSQKDKGTGLLEIISTISARHPSLNVLNIVNLNYYQIIDQYKRLLQIDKYTPCLYGNATEEYIKSNKVEHYSAKLVNE
jgi:hypothetical protein